MTTVELIRQIAFDVHHHLGKGRSEACYHKAMTIGLREANIPYETEVPILIKYKGYTVGTERADIIVDGAFIVELKAIKKIRQEDMDQLARYSKDLVICDGMVINFGASEFEFQIGAYSGNRELSIPHSESCKKSQTADNNEDLDVLFGHSYTTVPTYSIYNEL